MAETHNTYLSGALWQFQLTGEFTDVTLVCEDGKLALHSALLTGPLTRLCHEGGGDSVLVLLDRRVEEVREALRKMYLDQDTSAVMEILNMETENNCKNQVLDSKTDLFEIKSEPELDIDEDIGDLDGELGDVDENLGDIDEDLQSSQKNNLKFEDIDCDVHKINNEDEMESELAMKNEMKEDVKHVKENHTTQQGGKFYCEICPLSYKTKKILNTHVKVKHPDKISKKIDPSFRGGKWYCTVCEMVYLTKKALRTHVRHKHTDNTFECNTCHKTFQYKQVLIKHEGTHINPSPRKKRKSIELLGRTQRRKRLLEESLGQITYIKSCEACDFETKCAFKLKTHIRVVHEGKEPRKITIKLCSSCSYQTPSREKLKLHLKEVHGIESFGCELCEYKTPNLDRLAYHMKISHEGFRKYCDQCDWSGGTNTQLKEHVENVHLGIKQLCDQCDYQGPSKKALKEHKETDHEGKRVSCDQCNMVFTKKSSLDMHVKIKHQGFRYNCEFCSYQTTTGRALRLHTEANHAVSNNQA